MRTATRVIGLNIRILVRVGFPAAKNQKLMRTVPQPNSLRACGVPLEPKGSMGCAASPRSVVRPKDQRDTGSRSYTQNCAAATRAQFSCGRRKLRPQPQPQPSPSNAHLVLANAPPDGMGVRTLYTVSVLAIISAATIGPYRHSPNPDACATTATL